MSVLQLGLLALAAVPSIVALIVLPASRSRRHLVVALSLTIPVAGPVLAVMVTRIRGRGQRQTPADRAETLLAADTDVETIRRARELPSLLELLVSTDSTDRQAALVILSARANSTAITMLRWAIEHGPPEAVLDAALTLSELDVRFEDKVCDAEARFQAEPTFENAVDAAGTLTWAIRSGLADPTISVGLAARARELYQHAGTLPGAPPEKAHAQLARLELCLGNGRAALSALRPLAHHLRKSPTLRRMYQRARFTARERFQHDRPMQTLPAGPTCAAS